MKEENIKTEYQQNLLAVALVCALAFQGTAFAQSTHFDELANQPFPKNLPTK